MRATPTKQKILSVYLCRHLGFRKTTAISLLFDRSPPKLVETLGLRFGTCRRRRKCIVANIQDGDCRHRKYCHFPFVGCHFFTIWLIIAKFSRNIATLIYSTSVTSKNRINWSNCNSRWRPLPSWNSKNCCHFFTIWQNFTKISGHIGTSTWNISLTWQMHSCTNFHHL